MLRRLFSNRRGFIRSALAVPGIGLSAQTAAAQRKRRAANRNVLAELGVRDRAAATARGESRR